MLALSHVAAVLQVSALVVCATATVPALADSAMVPVASGVGSDVVPPDPAASAMR